MPLTKHKSNRDYLDRQTDIEFLTPLLNNLHTSYVISLEAPWGSGKSFFIDMWKKHLEDSEGYKCIKLNAWETDYIDDPFTTIMGEMSLIFSGESETNDPVKLKFLKALKYAVPVGKHLVKTGVKVFTGINVDLEDTGVERALVDGMSNIGQTFYENYEKNKNSMGSFKEALKEFADEIYSTTNKPLVIFIDELDRCRPDYTIELLEVIKHLFNINHVVFVLAVDRNALRSSVSSVFSSEIDVDSYLRKFVDLSINLPVRKLEFYINKIANDTFGLDTTNIKWFRKIAVANNASLRSIEQILSFYNLIVKTKSLNDFQQAMVSFLLALKFFYPKTYLSLQDKNAYAQLFANIPKIPKLKEVIEGETTLFTALLGDSAGNGYNELNNLVKNVCNSSFPDDKISVDFSKLPIREESNLVKLLSEYQIDVNGVNSLLGYTNEYGISLYKKILRESFDFIEFSENYIEI